MPRRAVTVYVTCHNYGEYLADALESVFGQILTDWELIVILDGCTDGSAQIAEQFRQRAPERVFVETLSEARGLRYGANLALQRARGRYFVRLDADDYFDQSALLVMSSYLAAHPDVALVYPNWIYVDQQGNYLGTERRKILGKEANVFDLPPHGACTMVRTHVLKAIGGYDTNHDSQDGHELWLKILKGYGVANLTTPLFFYRQHPSSMSRDNSRLLAARRRIKRALVSRGSGSVRPRAAAIIPAKNTYERLPNVVLQSVAGRSLIDYTVESALASECFEWIYVFTDDPAVIEYCRRWPSVMAELRESDLSSDRAKLAEVRAAAVHRLESVHGIYPDIVATLSVHTPLRGSEHIQEAIDTLLLYDVDSVVSTYEDLDLHFVHGKSGMEPINPGMIDELRFEREALYVSNGAIHVSWRDAVREDSLFQGRVGHFVMPRHLSYYVRSPHDLTVIGAVLEDRGRAAS